MRFALNLALDLGMGGGRERGVRGLCLNGPVHPNGILGDVNRMTRNYRHSPHDVETDLAALHVHLT
jgi:hypothetical protein